MGDAHDAHAWQRSALLRRYCSATCSCCGSCGKRSTLLRSSSRRQQAAVVALVRCNNSGGSWSCCRSCSLVGAAPGYSKAAIC